MLIKPKSPKPPKPKKKKLGEWKKSYDKKKPKPKPLPQGPKAKGKDKGKKKPAPKGKTPNWRDSTYLKQESYLKKLLADFNAKQIRSKADLAVYYGNEERAAQGEVREKDTVKKVEEDAPLPKAKPKPKQTNKTKGVKAGDEVAYTPKKKPAPKKKTTLGRASGPVKKPKDGLYQASGSVKPKSKLGKASAPLTTKEKAQLSGKKYKTIIVKGKVIRQATAGSKASDGLFHKELAEARLKDKVDITDDYAARGVLHSGLYAQKQGDYEKEYGKQVAETNRQKASKYADIAEENRDFLSDQELQKEQARLEAIRRKAAKVGKVA